MLNLNAPGEPQLDKLTGSWTVEVGDVTNGHVQKWWAFGGASALVQAARAAKRNGWVRRHGFAMRVTRNGKYVALGEELCACVIFPARDHDVSIRELVDDMSKVLLEGYGRKWRLFEQA